MRQITIVMMVFLFWACGEKEYRRLEGKMYGTIYHISYQSDQDLDVQIIAQMERVNSSLSMFNPSSVLAQLNRNETDRVDSLFVELWQTAKRVSHETSGAFDITVAPLSNAWGFGYKHEKLPTPEKVDSLLLLVGMDKIELVGDRIVKEREGMEIDASSIAKGLGVDLAALFLEASGVENYMIEIGGEVRVKGESDKKRFWRIGIDKPSDSIAVGGRELQLIIELGRGAVATSGNYRNFYMLDGKKYAHTINPKTGYPIQLDIISSTVYAPTCMEADAYATGFMVLGLEESKKVVAANPELEACFVYTEDGVSKMWMTDNFKKMILEEN